MNFLEGFDPKVTQTVKSIHLYRMSTDGSGAVGIEALGPVSRSELLRDLAYVVG